MWTLPGLEALVRGDLSGIEAGWMDGPHFVKLFGL